MLVTRCNITHYSLQNSLVTRCRSCSLQKVTRYSLQKVLVAKNHSLLVAEIANHSLFVAKFAHYSLQKLLVAKNHSLLVAKFARCSLQKWGHFLQLYEKVTPAQVFSCEFLWNLKNTYSVEDLRTAASENDIKTSTNSLQFCTSIKFFSLIWLSLIELLLNCLIKLN